MATTRPTTDHTPGATNVAGRVKRFLGWLTADRKVEAEGEAEVRTDGDPSAATVADVHHEIKQGYGESAGQDRSAPSARPANRFGARPR